MPQQLYCYVDESGQDTRGRLFVVSVVIAGSERDRLRDLCERIEQTSLKGVWKWTRVSRERQMAYARQMVAEPELRGKGIRTRKVRGARDESDALIRLADGVCGLVRAAEEGQPEMRRLLERGLQTGVLKDVSLK